MLQVLIWAVCVLIVSVGFCGMWLAKLTLKENTENRIGVAFVQTMIVFAVILLALSFVLSKKLTAIPGQLLP